MPLGAQVAPLQRKPKNKQIVSKTEAIFMSNKKKSPAVKPTTKAAKNGLGIAMDDEALKILAGFFDVLIQMDLNQKDVKKKRKKQ